MAGLLFSGFLTKNQAIQGTFLDKSDEATTFVVKFLSMFLTASSKCIQMTTVLLGKKELNQSNCHLLQPAQQYRYFATRLQQQNMTGIGND